MGADEPPDQRRVALAKQPHGNDHGHDAPGRGIRRRARDGQRQRLGNGEGRTAASPALDITEFVPLDKIDPTFFDSTYYLGPDKSGEKAYASGSGWSRRRAKRRKGGPWR